MSETGPVYNVELIDVLPMNYGQTGGMLQAMPSRADLIATQKKCNRVAAGYEILLNHWREQAEHIKAGIAHVAELEAEVERLQREARLQQKDYRQQQREIERLRDDLKDQTNERELYQAIAESVEVPPICSICNQPATCIGLSLDLGLAAMCDEHCGHGNEDSRCKPVPPTRKEIERLRAELDRRNGKRRDCQTCGNRTPFSGAVFCSEACVFKSAEAARAEQ